MHRRFLQSGGGELLALGIQHEQRVGLRIGDIDKFLGGVDLHGGDDRLSIFEHRAAVTLEIRSRVWRRTLGYRQAAGCVCEVIPDHRHPIIFADQGSFGIWPLRLHEFPAGQAFIVDGFKAHQLMHLG